MVIHLQADTLECEVKWTLGSITMNKTSGGDGILAELFKILKDDAVKSAALNMSAYLENSKVVTELKMLVFIEIPKKAMERMLKLLYNYFHFTS